MLDLIFGLLGGLWPYLVAAGAAVAAIATAYLKGGADRDRKRETQAVKRRLQTITKREELEHDAETQDDAGLVDRLTRR
ncbi:hypothetical protein OEW28_18560 [Defluviimonas sp. WL0002]|uniref:Uncharacterized protein n=1 Tax=Albidovulum marisflavi TaxID=2984159 RepID=A0ABT2ZHL6_9RHOB|nr:hypothetical protein [Defluviimonas sp. WL0002]MCV2870619.1 hypothetical protein [Defluviimonas sp. WL0002]